MSRHPGDPNLAGVKFDEEQDVEGDEAAEGPNLSAEAIRGLQHLHVGANEFSPSRGLLTIGSCGQASALEDIAHRLVTNLVAQFSVHPGHRQYGRSPSCDCLWPFGRSSLRAVLILGSATLCVSRWTQRRGRQLSFLLSSRGSGLGCQNYKYFQIKKIYDFTSTP